MTTAVAARKVLHVAGYRSCELPRSLLYSTRCFGVLVRHLGLVDNSAPLYLLFLPAFVFTFTAQLFLSSHQLFIYYISLSCLIYSCVFCFAGGFFVRTLNVLKSVAVLFPSRLKVVPHEFADRSAFRTWLIDEGFRAAFDDAKAKEQASSPFCWFSKTEIEEAKVEDIDSFLGGHDESLAWCRRFLGPCSDENGPVARMVDDGHQAEHGYDYDLVVIGGGSGGMACAKEAAALGAQVACLDFVKPSPHGTTWGLGGTCVNVGCIPKKLFHAGAMLRQAVQSDAAAYGIQVGDSSKEVGNDGDGDATMMVNGGGEELDAPSTTVKWDALRGNIQNYIRSLNFKYRVRLREKDVTYLNKLATFKDKHTIEAVDKKGRTSDITASRFLIATGGRPSPLACPGADLAISSDDVFALPQNPGKTLCVGASYISLECAGFLQTLGCDVTVAVRSILLRGFDRECADKIDTYMVNHGIKFKREVTPAKLEKVESTEQVKVTFSDGTEETYDTVLAAIGRQADTEKLGLDKIGVETNPKNRKVIGKFEQSSCPNVYAIGDVLDVRYSVASVAHRHHECSTDQLKFVFVLIFPCLVI